MGQDFDLLYNELVADEKLKAGTAYERLTAMVFKTLDADASVEHQVRLRGTGTARHWIDVVVRRGGEARRMLIECKSLEGKVPFEDALVFGGRVVQFPEHEGWIVTTVGFSPEAEAYMADQGIRGAILRTVTAADQIVKTVEVTAQMFFPVDVSVAWQVPAQTAVPPSFAPGLGDPNDIRILDEDGEFVESADAAIDRAIGSVGLIAGAHEVVQALPAGSEVEIDGARMAVTGYTVGFTLLMSAQTFTVGGEWVAALILANLDGAIEKVVTEAEIVALGFSGSAVVQVATASFD